MLRHNQFCVSYFNPRSPSGLRRWTFYYCWSLNFGISIHAARVGCDRIPIVTPARDCDFNPRSPSGLRRTVYQRANGSYYFNPRSPSGLRLFYINYLINWLENFNPRSPSGLRRPSARAPVLNNHFNPRSPSGLRHERALFCCCTCRISIHAARVGCDNF